MKLTSGVHLNLSLAELDLVILSSSLESAQDTGARFAACPCCQEHIPFTSRADRHSSVDPRPTTCGSLTHATAFWSASTLFLEQLWNTKPLQGLGSAYLTCSSDFCTSRTAGCAPETFPLTDYIPTMTRLSGKALPLNPHYRLPSQQTHLKTNKRKLSS